jgi:hypothetical protein
MICNVIECAADASLDVPCAKRAALADVSENLVKLGKREP